MLRVMSPVLYVDFWKATQQKLQLLKIENWKQSLLLFHRDNIYQMQGYLRNDIIEASKQCLHLFLYPV